MKVSDDMPIIKTTVTYTIIKENQTAWPVQQAISDEMRIGKYREELTYSLSKENTQLLFYW